MPGNHRSGARRKPTAVKLLEGTFRADRHVDEPQLPAKWPEPPPNLSDIELTFWKRFQREASLWVSEPDWPAVYGIVAVLGKIESCRAAQRETPTSGHPLAFKHYVEEKNGKTIEVVEAKENPLISQEIKLWRELRSYIGILGLSPVDRAHVKARQEPAAPKNPLEKFLAKRA